MIIERNSSKGSGLYPQAIEVLELLSEPELCFKEKGLRHPLAIYNVSLGGVLEQFSNVPDKLNMFLKEEAYREKGEGKLREELLKAQEDLLYHLMEHIDDCKNIINCILPPNNKEKINRYILKFIKEIHDYKNHIGNVVNKIKHQQGKLRSFTAFNSKIAIPGYFIEGIHSDGTVGPDKNIHQGGTTAFSFSRNLRFHFFHLYFVSLKLAEVIGSLSTHSKSDDTASPNDNSKRIIGIVKKINKIPPIVFPDENNLPKPCLTLSKKTKKHKAYYELFCSYLPVKRIVTLPDLNNMGFSVDYKGDGVSKQFKIPYS